MMGSQPDPQPSLFYTRFNLDERVPRDHPLRVIEAEIDFDFVIREVEHLYGVNGNESVPPPVILKLMFLLALENVASERRLLQVLPCRLDWLWFLRMDLDSPIPDHSVLSKARARWGAAAFRRFFERTIEEAVQRDLIDGDKIFCDGSLIDAHASRKSIEEVVVVELSAASDELERRLDGEDQSVNSHGSGDVSGRRTLRSTTDPDAAVVTKRGAGAARARYKAHRAVDNQHGVITATVVTPGDRNEARELMGLIDQHERTTGARVKIAVADTQYGTTDNYLACKDREITAHMRPLREVNQATRADNNLFTVDAFRYDALADYYECPAAQVLRPWQQRPDRNGVRYAAGARVCGTCTLRSQCTQSRYRTITRHEREDELHHIRALTHTPAARDDLRRRQSLMERTFAEGTRHGLKRSRWRRLWRAEIHELLIVAVQNIRLILRHPRKMPIAQSAKIQPPPATRSHFSTQLIPRLNLSWSIL